MFRKVVFFIILFMVGLGSNAQFAYRIKADVLTKTRLPDSTFQVSKGLVFYDQNYKKIVFQLTFPQKEEVVLYDTVMYVFVGDVLKEKTHNFLIPSQSVFHYMLSGKFSEYGLETSNFKATGVEKKKGLVITTWQAPEQFKHLVSKILIATQNKKLYSVTMVNGKGEVVNRQILKKYQMVDGLDLPTEILIATYLGKDPMYEIISLSNIKLNENGNETIYNKKL